MARRSTDGWRRAHLADLAVMLRRRGFDADEGTTPSGVPALHVANRDVPLLNEKVLCCEEPDGTLALLWAWGQRITDAHATAMAAVVVSQVLASRDG